MKRSGELKRKSPLARTGRLERRPTKRSRTKRDWNAARAKVEEEGRCRICGDPGDAIAVLEAAHIIGRKHDEVLWQRPNGERMLYVHPDRIVPLCRHMEGGCHPAYDAHQLDILSVLTLDEQVQAVRDAGGISLALRRLCPTEYPREPRP